MAMGQGLVRGFWGLLLLAVAMGAARDAHADRGFWFGAGYATSAVDVRLPVGRDAPFARPGADYADFSSSGARAAAGWRREYIGVEVGWVDFGSDVRWFEQPCNLPPGGNVVCPPPGSQLERIAQKGSAAWVAFTPTYDAGRWTLSAKLGVARIRVEDESLDWPFNHGDGYTRDTRLMYGVAGTLPISQYFSLRLDIDAYHDRAHTMGLSGVVRF